MKNSASWLTPGGHAPLGEQRCMAPGAPSSVQQITSSNIVETLSGRNFGEAIVTLL
jgi:hypothetical protein